MQTTKKQIFPSSVEAYRWLNCNCEQCWRSEKHFFDSKGIEHYRAPVCSVCRDILKQQDDPEAEVSKRSYAMAQNSVCPQKREHKVKSTKKPKIMINNKKISQSEYLNNCDAKAAEFIISSTLC